MTLSTLMVLLASSPAQSDSSPLVPAKSFPVAMQWNAIEGTAKLNVRTSELIIGSSVVLAIKDDHIWLLTANHVVRENVPIDVDFYRRASYPARDYTLRGGIVVAKNKAADLALVKVPLEDKPPLDVQVPFAPIFLATEEEKLPPVLRLAAPGTRPHVFPFPVLAVGCDDSYSARCSDDSANARSLLTRYGNEIAFFWETAAKSKPGRSGGPLLDKDGRVIGICSGYQSERGYYTHIDEIHAWLKPLGYEWLWKDAGKK